MWIYVLMYREWSPNSRAITFFKIKLLFYINVGLRMTGFCSDFTFECFCIVIVSYFIINYNSESCFLSSTSLRKHFLHFYGSSISTLIHSCCWWYLFFHRCSRPGHSTGSYLARVLCDVDNFSFLIYSLEPLPNKSDAVLVQLSSSWAPPRSVVT